MKWDNTATNRNTYRGFTIIEVVLVLAITGLIFVGAVVGVGSTLSRQRYADTVDSIADILRTQYDHVSRTQIEERSLDESICKFSTSATGIDESQRGRSKCNVYGVAVILGANQGRKFQSFSLIGRDYSELREALVERCPIQYRNTNEVDDAYMKLSELQLLGMLNVSNYFISGGVSETLISGVDCTDPSPYFEVDGTVRESSMPSNSQITITNSIVDENYRWEASLQNIDGSIAKYIMLVVRSPRDGTIHTYIYDISSDTDFAGPNGREVVDYSGKLAEKRQTTNNSSATLLKSDIQYQDINDLLFEKDKFKSRNLCLCVASEDYTQIRRTIHITRDGHSSSAIELISPDVDVAHDFCNNSPEDYSGDTAQDQSNNYKAELKNFCGIGEEDEV